VGAQNRDEHYELLIYEGVKLDRGGIWFEPVLSIHKLECRECEVGDSKLSETLVFIYESIHHIPDETQISHAYASDGLRQNLQGARAHKHTHIRKQS